MNIQYEIGNQVDAKELLIPWPGTDRKVPAGSPISNAGAVVNDGTAIGLLMNDLLWNIDRMILRDGNAYAIGLVQTAGYIDKAAAEKNTGVTYDDAVIAALPNIVFVDGAFQMANHLPTVPDAGEETKGLVLQAANVAAPADADGLLTAVTGLLEALKDAGIMAPDAEPEAEAAGGET